MQLSSERKKDLYFILAFAVLVMIYFWRVLFLGGAFPGGDILNQFHPWKQFLVDQVRAEGRVPLWNALTFSGNPFAANFQIGIWYPLDVLFFFMPVVDAFRFSVVLHFFLSCVFMYILARHFKLSHWSSFIAGLLFTFSGFMVTRMYAGNYTLVTTYPWIPIIFYFFDRLLQTNKTKYLVFFGLCISCQILGGHPQPAYYTWLLLFVYAVFQVGFRKHDKESWQKSLQPIGWYLLCVLLVAGLTAIQLLPTYELSHYSAARAGGAPYKFATSSSLSWRHLMLLFTPYLFGTPLDDTYWLDGSGYVETCGFTGILAVLLVMYTLVAVRNRKVLLWGSVLFLAFFLGFGRYNLVYPVLFNIIPGIKLFRCPGRWLMMVNFAIAMIVPIGLDYLWYSQDESLWKTYKKYLIAVMVGGVLILALYGYMFLNTSSTLQNLYKYQVKVLVEEWNYTAQEAMKMIPDDAMPNRYELILQKYQEFMVIYLVVFLVLLFFYYKRRHPLQTWLVSGIVLLELWNWGGSMLQIEPRDKYLHRFQHSPEIQSFQDDKSLYRIADMDTLISWKYTTEEFEFRPNRLMIHQLPSVRGYDPTVLKHYAEYLNILTGYPLNQPQGGLGVLGEYPAFTPQLLGLLNAKYVNSMIPVSLDYLSGINSGRFITFQNKECYPRVFFVPKAMIIPDNHQRARLMRSSTFHPREFLVLESKPQDVPGDVILPDTTTQVPVPPVEVTMQDYHGDVQMYQVNLPQKGFVFFSEIWYPGWKLTANRKEIPILRANHTFRAAYLPPGQYLLKMEFLPASFYWGKRISELTILLCVLLLMIPLLRKRFHR